MQLVYTRSVSFQEGWYRSFNFQGIPCFGVQPTIKSVSSRLWTDFSATCFVASLLELVLLAELF
ncbi:hypothetical protein P692DRAFT_20837207 [Suillus brevipes Sb2]|nr:hypothetical protein P692DRAFT_20837207 [Suillus brevipes Sb2]